MSARADEPGGPTSLAEAVAWLRKHFDAEAAGAVRLHGRFQLDGPGGGELGLRVADGRLEIDPPDDGSAEVRFRLAAADFLAILAGRANAELLFMEGRVEVQGDLSLALQVRRLFRRRG